MVGLDYGYRSKCCYAPIRLGRKKIKNTNQKVQVWVCTRCKTRDVDIVQYTGPYHSESTSELNSGPKFIPEDEDIYQD